MSQRVDASNEFAASGNVPSRLMMLPLELRLQIFGYLEYPTKVIIACDDSRNFTKRNHWSYIDTCFRRLKPIMYDLKDVSHYDGSPLTIATILKQLMAIVTSSDDMRDIFIRHRMLPHTSHIRSVHIMRRMGALAELQEIFEACDLGRKLSAPLLVSRAMHRDVSSVYQEKAEIGLDLAGDIERSHHLEMWQRAISEISISKLRTASIEFFVPGSTTSLCSNSAPIALLMNWFPNLTKFSACVKLQGGIVDGVDVSGTCAEPDLIVYARHLLDGFVEAIFRSLSHDSQKSLQKLHLLFLGTGYGAWSVDVDRPDHVSQNQNTWVATVKDYKSRDVRVYSVL